MESRSQALGNLAQGGGVLISTKLAITEDFRMLKSHITCILTALTAGEAQGLGLYLINGDLSLAEAEAKIETEGPVSRHDRIGAETAERFVRKVGFLGNNVDPASTTQVFLDVHTGAPMCTAKPRWTFGHTTSWQWMIYNHGLTLTTGATAQLKVENFGVWVE